MFWTIFGILFFGFFALAIYKSIGAAGKRIAAYKGLAESMGLAYYPECVPSLKEAVEDLPLFNEGEPYGITNMIYGETERGELAAFDYGYRVGGKDMFQYVVYLRANTLSLPHFALRPEKLIHKISSAFAHEDIDFKGHRQFSKQFFLSGDNEEEVRALFTDELIGALEQRPGICVEGGGAQLIYFKRGKFIFPPVESNATAFIDEAAQVFKLFTP